MAVIASTLDLWLDLLSGFILWFTAHTMKKPNKYNYPIGKRRMLPVVRTLFNKPCHFDLVESRLQI
jgi:divalent metal cation (Fe/Co/Zn/Cd) transporter